MDEKNYASTPPAIAFSITIDTQNAIRRCLDDAWHTAYERGFARHDRGNPIPVWFVDAAIAKAMDDGAINHESLSKHLKTSRIAPETVARVDRVLAEIEAQNGGHANTRSAAINLAINHTLENMTSEEFIEMVIKNGTRPIG